MSKRLLASGCFSNLIIWFGVVCQLFVAAPVLASTEFGTSKLRFHSCA